MFNEERSRRREEYVDKIKREVSLTMKLPSSAILFPSPCHVLPPPCVLVFRWVVCVKSSWQCSTDWPLAATSVWNTVSSSHLEVLIDTSDSTVVWQFQGRSSNFVGRQFLWHWYLLLHSQLDLSLPAIFLPSSKNLVFSPRARQFFHPTGSDKRRLTQPPAVFKLPPLRLEVMRMHARKRIRTHKRS